MKTFSSIEKKKEPLRSTLRTRKRTRFPDGIQQVGAVRQILGRPHLQAKLTVGAPSDALEQEADRVAGAVMRTPAEALQRHPLEEEGELLQSGRDGGGAVDITPELEQEISSSRGHGRPLSDKSRSFFQPRMGLDLGQVKVHAGPQAADWTRRIHARAFALGSDIFFGAGQFSPESFEGKKLLAHELTHTIQQSGDKTSRERSIRRNPDEEAGTGESVESTLTLTNQRFAGNQVLEWILSGRIPRLSSRYNGREGAVSKVQQALVDLGFELPMNLVDGQYGDETEEALRQFRDRHGPSAGNQLDGAALAVLDRVAPAPGIRQEHTVDYDRLLADGRLDVTVAIGATDTTVFRETEPGRYERTGRPTEELRAERFRTWMQGQGLSLELLGWSGNEHWKGTRTITWTDSGGTRRSREVDIWINLIIPATGAAREFGEGLGSDEITIYSGHARYGSGPDFDAKASPLENFRIGIDRALQAAGRRTRVDEARRHGVAIDEEHDLLEMTRSGNFDADRYRVLFFDACTSLAYLDEIREHVGGTENVDVIATRRPSRFTRIESEAGLREAQRFLEGIFSAESVESVIGGLNDIQRRLHGGSVRFPRGGVYSSSGMGDN